MQAWSLARGLVRKFAWRVWVTPWPKLNSDRSRQWLGKYHARSWNPGGSGEKVKQNQVALPDSSGRIFFGHHNGQPVNPSVLH